MERVVGVTPTADTELEHISNVLLEGNIFADNEGPDMAYTSIGIIAQHVVVRNNVMINPDNAIQVSGNPLLPAHYVDQIEIYNNTVYMFPAAGVDNTYTINFLAHTSGAAAGTVTIRNNIWAEGMTSAASSYVFSDGMGTEIEDHNLGFAPNVSGTWGGAPASAGDVVGDPTFVSTDPTNASAFHLSTGSAAIDVGDQLCPSIKTWRARLARRGPTGTWARSSSRRRGAPPPSASCPHDRHLGGPSRGLRDEIGGATDASSLLEAASDGYGGVREGAIREESSDRRVKLFGGKVRLVEKEAHARVHDAKAHVLLRTEHGKAHDWVCLPRATPARCWSRRVRHERLQLSCARRPPLGAYPRLEADVVGQ